METQQLAPLQSDTLIPHLDQFFGPWAMEETRFLNGLEQIRAMDIRLHLEQVKAAGGSAIGRSYSYEPLSSGIVVMDLAGTMMKHVNSLTSGTSTVMMRNALRRMRSDDNVTGLLVRADSPGGTVAGTQDLADELAALAAVKPVAVHIEDLAASACIWVISQAAEISANRGALVGSIGTYGVVHDYSGWAAKEGIKVYVIRAGEFKGAGTPGTEVTEPQRAEMKRIVDALNQDFLDGVAKGRRLSAEKVKAMADGRVHKAPDSKDLGLVDHIESLDAALSRLEARIQSRRKQPAGGRSEGGSNVTAQVQGPEKESQMTQQNAATQTQAAQDPRPATIAELKQAFPDNPAFALDCAEKALTLTEAKAAYSDVLAAENKRLKEQAQAGGKPSGVKPLADGKGQKKDEGEETAATGDGAEQFQSLVAAKVKGGMDRRQAVVAVARTNPDLHRAYLESTNPGKKQRALIADRFETN